MLQNESWQKMLKEERLPHQLRVQSHQIERVFMQRQIPTQVAGEKITRQHIQFDIQTQLAIGWEKLRGLKRDVLSALGVDDLQLIRENGVLKVRVERPETAPVELIELLPLLPQLSPITAALGVSEDGRPVLLELLDQDLAHVLISGGSGAGKTTLLRSTAVSLASSNKQSQLQMLIIDAKGNNAKNNGSKLEPLTYLPHLLEPVLSDHTAAIEALQFVVGEVAYRQQQRVKTPIIVILIDHIVALLEAGGQTAEDALITLAQKGADAGVHLILSTTRPESEKLSPLLKATIPVRLIGYNESEGDDKNNNQVTIESVEIYPEYLDGKGDFIAVVGETATHFQAAYVGDYDLHLMLDALRRHRLPPLLAHSFMHKDVPLSVEKEENGVVEEPVMTFSRNNDDFSIFSVEDDDEIDEIPFDAGDGWPKMN